MDDRENRQTKVTRGAWTVLYVLGVIILALLVCLCSGCSAVRRVTSTAEWAEEARADTVYLTRQATDSVLIRDSIFIHEKNDTVYQYVERWRVREKVRTDTVYLSRVDSVFVEKERATEVKGGATWWQKIMQIGFCILFVSIVVGLLVLFKFRQVRG